MISTNGLRDRPILELPESYCYLLPNNCLEINYTLR